MSTIILEYFDGEFITIKNKLDKNISDMNSKLSMKIPTGSPLAHYSAPNCIGGIEEIRTALEDFQSTLNEATEKVDTMVQGYRGVEGYALGAIISLDENTRYAENSMGQGRSNTIREGNIYARPGDKFLVKYIAIYADGKYKYNMILDSEMDKGVSLDDRIAQLKKDGIIDENAKITVSQGIANSENRGDLGWLDQVSYVPGSRTYEPGSSSDIKHQIEEIDKKLQNGQSAQPLVKERAQLLEKLKVQEEREEREERIQKLEQDLQDGKSPQPILQELQDLKKEKLGDSDINGDGRLSMADAVLAAKEADNSNQSTSHRSVGEINQRLQKVEDRSEELKNLMEGMENGDIKYDDTEYTAYKYEYDYIQDLKDGLQKERDAISARRTDEEIDAEIRQKVQDLKDAQKGVGGMMTDQKVKKLKQEISDLYDERNDIAIRGIKDRNDKLYDEVFNNNQENSYENNSTSNSTETDSNPNSGSSNSSEPKTNTSADQYVPQTSDKVSQRLQKVEDRSQELKSQMEGMENGDITYDNAEYTANRYEYDYLQDVKSGLEEERDALEGRRTNEEIDAEIRENVKLLKNATSGEDIYKYKQKISDLYDERNDIAIKDMDKKNNELYGGVFDDDAGGGAE